jgi:hypothetical protein
MNVNARGIVCCAVLCSNRGQHHPEWVRATGIASVTEEAMDEDGELDAMGAGIDVCNAMQCNVM